MSDKESNCSHKGFETFNNLAAAPSIKSKMAARQINTPAQIRCPSMAKIVANTPDDKFSVVIKLGICFVIVLIENLKKM